MSMADDLCTLQPRETYGSRAMIELVFPSLCELLRVHFASMYSVISVKIVTIRQIKKKILIDLFDQRAISQSLGGTKKIPFLVSNM